MAAERKSKAADDTCAENKHQDESPNNDATDVEDLAPNELENMSLHVLSQDRHTTIVYNADLLRDGDIVYTFQPDECVKKTTQSAVFKRTLNGRLYAVKQAKSAVAACQILNEAMFLQYCQSNDIEGFPAVRQVTSDNCFPRTALDWVPGISLWQLVVRKGPQPDTLISMWACDLRAQLSKIHQLGYVHCDVTPPNIIIDGKRAILVDFGLITAIGATPLGVCHRSFRSPDVLCGANPRPKDDFHSLSMCEQFARQGVEVFARKTCVVF